MHKTSSEHQMWQEGFHRQQIMNEEMLVNKIEYIHYNPMRRNLVKNPEHWIFSSAEDYCGGQGVLEIDRLEF
jgi:putative transposase